MIAKGASRISLVSSDPDALAGLDSKKIACFSNLANGKALKRTTQSDAIQQKLAGLLLQLLVKNGQRKSFLI